MFLVSIRCAHYPISPYKQCAIYEQNDRILQPNLQKAKCR